MLNYPIFNVSYYNRFSYRFFPEQYSFNVLVPKYRFRQYKLCFKLKVNLCSPKLYKNTTKLMHRHTNRQDMYHLISSFSQLIVQLWYSFCWFQSWCEIHVDSLEKKIMFVLHVCSWSKTTSSQKKFTWYHWLQFIISIYYKKRNIWKREGKIPFDFLLQPLTWSQSFSVQLHADWQFNSLKGKKHLSLQSISADPSLQTLNKMKKLNHSIKISVFLSHE